MESLTIVHVHCTLATISKPSNCARANMNTVGVACILEPSSYKLSLASSGPCKCTVSSMNCSLPYTRHEYAIVAGLSAASAFVSLLASCFIVALIVLFKKWRFFSQRLVLYLAVSVILESVATIIHRVDYENETTAFYVRFCQFSAFVEQNTSWIELMAVVSITVYIFVCAVFSKRTDRFELLYLFFIFVFPLLFNWIPFTVDAYGRAGAWCWIKSEDIYSCDSIDVPGRTLQLVLWYVPLYVILIVLISLFVMILIKIHCYDSRKYKVSKHEDKHIHEQMSKEIRSLLWYPFIYFMINLIPFINRIHGLAQPNNPSLALWILSALLFPLQGGFIALAFTLDPDTRKRLKIVHIRAAAKELCQKSGKTVKEYPAEHAPQESDGINEYPTRHMPGSREKRRH